MKKKTRQKMMYVITVLLAVIFSVSLIASLV